MIPLVNQVGFGPGIIFVITGLVLVAAATILLASAHLEVGHHDKVERRSPSDWVRSLHSTVAREPLLPADPSRYRAADCHRVRVDSLGHVEDRKNKSFRQIGKVACQTESRIRRPSLKVIHGALFAGDGWLLSVSAFLGAIGRVTGLMRGGFETPDFAIAELHISIGRS